jgi:hypothetical protein
VKRWTLKLTLCLLAGAVVTWAVAWGCALWGQRPDLSTTGTLNSRPAVPSTYVLASASAGRTTAATEERWEFNMGNGSIMLYRIGYGMPMRSFKSSGIGQAFVTNGDWDWQRLHSNLPGILAPAWMAPRDQNRWLPTIILPLGFTINTLLAAGVVLSVVEGIGAARRRRRRSKGRCPSCGYDRGGLDAAAACPECGRGVAA